MKKMFLSLAMITASMACFAQNEAFKSFTKHFSDTAAFAYANIGNRQVLLVSHETFGNNIDTNLEAVETSIFALDEKGKIVSLGSIRSQGTLYPVSMLDNKLMVAGHHFVKIYNIRGDVPELVLDSYEEGDYDNPKLKAMFEKFEKGNAVMFEKN
ncbi:MAG: hypothetical protein KBT29_11550 [Prevotellaceae bacterium]|nr:hypothetical protein [Candidatus Minthosoma caballi]